MRIRYVFSSVKQQLRSRANEMLLIMFQAAIIAAGFEILMGNQGTSEDLGVVGFTALTACIILAAINVINGSRKG